MMKEMGYWQHIRVQFCGAAIAFTACLVCSFTTSNAGIAGLVTAQKTINTLLNTKDENNILTLINTSDFTISNINIKNNVNCVLNNS